MPTYEYQCTVCKHLYEKFQSMSEKPDKKCPKCGKKVDRLISAGAGLIFKGSGFYETDYKKRSCPSDASEKPSCAAEKKGACGGACSAASDSSDKK